MCEILRHHAVFYVLVSVASSKCASVQGELNKAQLIDFDQLTELFFDTFLNFVEDYKIA